MFRYVIIALFSVEIVILVFYSEKKLCVEGYSQAHYSEHRNRRHWISRQDRRKNFGLDRLSVSLEKKQKPLLSYIYSVHVESNALSTFQNNLHFLHTIRV